MGHFVSGIHIQQIADYLGIARSTFFSLIQRDSEIGRTYHRGRARAIGSITQSLITNARNGDTASMTFYLKTQAGWRETPLERTGQVLGRFTEVESGRHNDRSQLEAALKLAKLTGAMLVIAKLDRLSRNAAVLLALRDSGVRFVACDMPKANDLTVGTMALAAKAERNLISKRTKEALAAARARGVRLSGTNDARALRCEAKGKALPQFGHADIYKIMFLEAGICAESHTKTITSSAIRYFVFAPT